MIRTTWLTSIAGVCWDGRWTRSTAFRVKRIKIDILKEERADYGKEIVHALSAQLMADFGRANLFHMVRFAEVFPDEQIVYALSRQLGWTHLRQIIYLKEPLQREFYAEMCRIERWLVAI